MNSFMHASAQLSLTILYSQGSPAQEMIPATIMMCFSTLIDQDSLRHSQRLALLWTTPYMCTLETRFLLVMLTVNSNHHMRQVYVQPTWVGPYYRK